MFWRFLLWISHLWGLLCEFIKPSTPVSQPPSTSASNAVPSQTQSTSASRSTPTCWDVFLSFRGTDTRLNFTGHLYDKLESNGIRTFMDNPELRSGEVISDALLDAIKKSKTYVVVLSENYAFSSWCLDELVEIYDCHKRAERLVIPVFYKIHPFVVRHQVGKFNEAFRKHRRRVKLEKVNKWRLALKQIAGLSGFHISEYTFEADITNQIVEEIQPKLNSKDLDVAKYPVGLESRVKYLTSLLNNGTKERFTGIGLFGMGGVGKTTLAKALFNHLLTRESFMGSCFLANVREASRTFKGIASLQQKLINDVLRSKKEIKVDSVEEGIMLIKQRICSAKVLVLIDDLDDPGQYESLVGSFSSGSVVITTTRDQEILDKLEVESKFQYRVNELDDAESLALFTRHAFQNAEQNNTLMVLCSEIVPLADGLPLALEVFGSYLYKKDMVGWKSYIEKLQRVPDNSIQEKLIISLDAVELDDPMLKMIFLDIACFFIGWDKEEVDTVLETYYPFADHKIDILQKRCLVKINYNAYSKKSALDMHDLLRDMGREVVRKISPDVPGRQSRLWISGDVYDVLKKHKGTDKVEGVTFDYQYVLGKKPYSIETFETFSTKTFRKMRKLRFLYLKDVNLTGSFEQTFEDLRWFCWHSCPLKCLPTEFYPKKLVILELPHSQMKAMWELNMVLHIFGKLKTLNMSYSRNLSATADFTWVPCLETLNLRGCANLEDVHMSIRSLVRLIYLNLEGCVKLRSLPDSICDLRALKVLTVSQCKSLEALPMQLGNITSLTELNAKELTVLKLPESLGYLPNLVKLGLAHNKKLETLPDTICNLKSLEILDIECCSNLKALPLAIGNLVSLKKINAEKLTVLKLPDSIGTLTKLVELDLRDNKKLETLPDTICNLISLEILDIGGCSSLEALPTAIGNMESLKKIFAGELNVSKLPESLGSLTKLVKLDLRDNKKLEALPDTICNLISLENLNIDSCTSLEALPTDIGNIESLKKIDVRNLNVFRLPDSIGRLTKLDMLDLSYNKKLDILPNTICNLRSLEILRVYDCEKIEILPDRLWEITSLRELNANGATGLKKLPQIGSSKIVSSLQKLDLSSSGITALPSGFSQLTNLQSLHISGCFRLLFIPELPQNLKGIRAAFCSSLGRLQNLYHLKQLETLDLEFCKDLIEIHDMEELTALRDLNFEGCSGLTEIQGMDRLTSIRRLRLGHESLHLLTKRLLQVRSSLIFL